MNTVIQSATCKCGANAIAEKDGYCKNNTTTIPACTPGYAKIITTCHCGTKGIAYPNQMCTTDAYPISSLFCVPSDVPQVNFCWCKPRIMSPGETCNVDAKGGSVAPDCSEDKVSTIMCNCNGTLAYPNQKCSAGII